VSHSKLLVKLVDRAIIPALLLLGAKIIGTFFVSGYIGIQNFDGLKPFSGMSPSDYVFVNSYSTVFVFGVIFFGVVWTLFKAHITHDTHITPYLSSRLASLKLMNLVQDSVQLFSEAGIWLTYSWLLTITTLMQAFLGGVYIWLPVVSLVFSIIATLLTFWDVEKEIGSMEEISEDSLGSVTTTYLEFQ